MHPSPEIDAENIADTSKFTIQTYNDKSKPTEMPPFLIEPDFYFAKSELAHVKDEDIAALSDSEIQTKQTQEDMDLKRKDRTSRSLNFLVVSPFLAHF